MKRIIEQQQNLHSIFPMDMKYTSNNINSKNINDDDDDEDDNDENSLLTTATTTTTSTVVKSMSTLIISLCGNCCRPIYDRYLMRVVDKSYHEKCLQCTACSIDLIGSCFIKDGKLLCRHDYERLFVKNRCLGCCEKIAPGEYVMRALDNVFHLNCFVCVVCGVKLQKGEQYVIKQSQLFCRMDYEKEVEMLQCANDEFYCEDLYHTRIDGRRGPKRPRTILTTQQRRAFKSSFEVSPKPCRKIRETLARETGLSIRIVQVWFQNQRAKVKKIQNKARQDGGKCSKNCDDMLNDSNDKIIVKVKDENHSDSDSFASGISHDSISYRPIKEEMENDEEYFKLTTNFARNLQNCDEQQLLNNKTKDNNSLPMNTIMSLGYTSLQQMVASQIQILNPIDRLYSMQSQYFKTDELNQNLNDGNM